MTKKFILPLMTTALPALLASCMDAPTQTTQTYSQSVPDGCELEADGDIDCDDSSFKRKKSYSSSSGTPVNSTGYVSRPPISSSSRQFSSGSSSRVNASPSVSRGGFTSSARASGTSGGYGG